MKSQQNRNRKEARPKDTCPNEKTRTIASREAPAAPGKDMNIVTPSGA